jgi:cysteine synthase/O-phosphoserine sulfhydrylase/cystathionine beta-synthase
MTEPYITEVQLVELDKLRQHEEVDPAHLKELKEEIKSDKILKFAIVVDKNTNIILDGEHRFNSLKELGCRRIPVVYVDYNSPDIQVQSWRNNLHLTKKDVIEAGLGEKKLPPKTSKHMIKIGDRLLHISAIQKRTDVPLEVLRNDVEHVDIKDVKPAMCTELREVLPLYAKFLDTGIVDNPIIVDWKTGVILEGHEVYQALDLLSAGKVPAIKVNILEMKIRSLQPDLKPITAEAIIEAGLKGPRLPPKSFKVLLEHLKISVPLGELLAPEEKDRRILKVYNSTLELLYEGWPTPLVKLKSLSNDKRSVWAKLEGYNPFSNSVKDRIGWSMLNDALERGAVRQAIYEATSTNTGIALTSIANTLGVKAKLYIPQTIQKVSDVYLKVLGAEVIRLPVGLTVEAIGQVDFQAKADNATHLNQFENDANFKVHLKYTARELDQQLQSVGLKPSYIIGGLGTSGHMSAISFYFKNKYRNNVKIVGVQPAPNEVIPGIRRVETGMKWFHWVDFDEVVDVKQVEAIEAAIGIARKEGLLIGLSAGAVVHAFNKISKDEGVYVLIFPDTGYKYAEQFENYFKNLKEQRGCNAGDR